jgi:hypothetical protein
MKYIKPFLIFLDIFPDRILNIDEEDFINTDCIDMDQGIIEALRKI